MIRQEQSRALKPFTHMLLFRRHYVHPSAKLTHSEETRFPLRFEEFGTEGCSPTRGLRYADLQIEDVQLLRHGER